MFKGKDSFSEILQREMIGEGKARKGWRWGHVPEALHAMEAAATLVCRYWEVPEAFDSDNDMIQLEY